MIYYPNAGVLVRYWVNTYGLEKINSLFSVSKDHFKDEFESITGTSWNEMAAEYHKYIETF